jgi:hypothetical protein
VGIDTHQVTGHRLLGILPGTGLLDQVTGNEPTKGVNTMWDFILWIAAVILVVFGIVRLVQKDILWGIVLIVLGLLIGPGGVSLLT